MKRRPGIYLLAVIFAVLAGCTTYISTSKPTSPNFVQVAVAEDDSGKPAVAIHRISTTTHGFQTLDVPSGQQVLYLLPNEYVAEVRCLRTFDGHPMPSYNSYLRDTYSGFTFSVETGQHYLLDCAHGEDMADFILIDADTHVIVKRFLF